MITTNYATPINRTFCTNNFKTGLNQKNTVSFCANPVVDTLNFTVSKALSKLNDFSTESYKTLSEAEKTALRDEYDRIADRRKTISFKDIEFLHDYAANGIKKYLENTYFKDSDNCIVIIIGRSLSSIGKVLGYMIGEKNVKNIPMSKAHIYLKNNYLEELNTQGKLKILEEYLDSVGLSRENMQDSKNKYVLMDYCFSGESLAGAENLFRHIYGDLDNLTTCNVINCFDNTDSNTRTLNRFLHSELFKDYSFVKYTETFDNLNSAVVKPEECSRTTKLIWFKLLDNFMLKQKN